MYIVMHNGYPMRFATWLPESTKGGALDRLRYKQDGLTVYKAGLPKFGHNFTRDGIISAILLGDPVMLRDQIAFCALHQGKEKDRFAGEEPGKIFHEIELKEYRGRHTKYNACDTTALFLLGHEIYIDMTGDRTLAEKQKENIERAADYILSHLKEGLFIEDPRFCGARRFALKVTYWKDSGVHSRDGGEPEYPVTYGLVHIQNMRGLKSASRLLKSVKIEKAVKQMQKALSKVYNEELGIFRIAIDRQGPIDGVASDSLHALFYLDQKEFPALKAQRILETSEVLETPIGYRSLDPENSDKALRDYHSKTVWPFEQAMIHIGSKKFGLSRGMMVSSRIADYLTQDHEMVAIRKNGEMTEGGVNPCLWTIAAKYYFENHKQIHTELI